MKSPGKWRALNIVKYPPTFIGTGTAEAGIIKETIAPFKTRAQGAFVYKMVL